MDGGLMTLSKYPIVDSEFSQIIHGFYDEGLAFKGVLYTKIKLGSNHLYLFNTHASSSNFKMKKEEFASSYNVRSMQMGQCAEFIDKKTIDAKEDDLIVLCGDFNVDSGDISI
jgi:endonuclease/exonuclease/phosphatase family metal-dependent hydrolase